MNDLPYLLQLQNSPLRKRPLRIATVTETYPPEVNGVAMTIERMVMALRAKGHQIQLVRPRQQAEAAGSATIRADEVLTSSLPIPGYEWLRMGLPSKSRLVSLWSSNPPDVVHVVTEGPLGWSAVSAAIKLGLPVVSDFHTNFHTYSKHYGLGLLRWPINAYLRNFHNKGLCTFVPTHELSGELIRQGYRNLVVVARGVDCELFRPARRNPELRRQWGAAGNDIVAIYVGRLAPEKNLSLVLEAYRRMRAANSRIRMVMVGDGPARGALKASHPEVLFAGERTGAELAQHYASADAFLFASTSETYGNVTMEAMASGLAVVAYDYAAAKEHIRHGKNGLLAPFNQAGDFILQAERLASRPEEVARLGLEARRTAVGVGWDSIHRQFEQILMNVVRPRGKNDAQPDRFSFVQD